MRFQMKILSDKQKTCCICESHFTGFGCNPDPFDGEVGLCCQACDERFVIPVRIIWGRGGHGAPLGAFKRLAATGASIRQLGEMDESQDV